MSVDHELERSSPWARAYAEHACDHPVTDIRRILFSDGRPNYARQCMRCGEQVGTYLKHSSFSEEQRASFEDFDREKKSAWRAGIRKRAEVLIAEETDQKEEQRSEFWEQYNAYLASDRWRDKRRRVLERDNHRCQACLQRRATKVHHTTYKHVFNEPLFELVAVCETCHDAITRMDRGQDS